MKIYFIVVIQFELNYDLFHGQYCIINWKIRLQVQVNLCNVVVSFEEV